MSLARLSPLDCRQFSASLQPLSRAFVAGALVVLMVDQPLIAAAATTKRPVAKTVAATQIQGDERVLHALDRLTFGPRPGDVEAVKAMGLKAWFERQLNPSAIDDSALEAKLEMFPAMKMPQAEMIERYPQPQVIKQFSEGKGTLPTDPVERALYQDQIAYYQQQKKKEASLKADAPAQQAAGMADAGGENSMAVPAAVAPAARKKANARPSLVPDMAGPVGGKNKNGAAGADAMAMQAGQVAAGDMGGDDAIVAAGRGRREHNEAAFPEAKTQQMLAMDPDARMLAVLSLEPDQLIAFRRSLSQEELVGLVAGLSPLQKEQLASLQGSGRVVSGELMESRMMRDVYSDRQLEAVMTDFWLNHFNVYVRKNQQEPYLIPAYEREVIRPNALGNFETLLVATAKSPAMQMYLDNYQSVGPDSLAVKYGPRMAAQAQNPQVQKQLNGLKGRGLNENYARELMELHTLGVVCEVSKDRPVSALPGYCGTGYTQADVTNVAKVLTGWTIDRPYQGAEFVFDERRHELGPKTVLGTTIQSAGEDAWVATIGTGRAGLGNGRRREVGAVSTPMDAAGEGEGLQLLHMLATSPATAHFISYKLAMRFVSDAPPEALVDRMAKSFLASNGDIKTVLRTMFDAPEFWSPKVYRAKVKTPEEFVISAVRASGATVQNALPLVQALNQLGMGFYGMQTPNGYSWKSDEWVSTGALVSRMNFALVLSGNRLGGTRVNWPVVLGEGAGYKAVGLETTKAGDDGAVKKERVLEQMLLGEPVSEKTRTTVLAQSVSTEATDQAVKFYGAQNAGALLNNDGGANRAQVPQDRQAAVIAGLLLGSPEFQRR